MPIYGTVLDPLAAGPDQCVEFAVTGRPEGGRNLHRGSILLTNGNTLQETTKKRVRDHVNPLTAFSAIDSSYHSASTKLTIPNHRDADGQGLAIAQPYHPVGWQWNFPRRAGGNDDVAAAAGLAADAQNIQYQTFAHNLRTNVAFGGIVVDQHGDMPVKDGVIDTGDPRARVAAQVCGTTTIPFRMPTAERDHLKIGNPVYLIAYPTVDSLPCHIEVAEVWAAQAHIGGAHPNMQPGAGPVGGRTQLRGDGMSFSYVPNVGSFYSYDEPPYAQNAVNPARRQIPAPVQQYQFCVDATFHVLRNNGGAIDPANALDGIELGAAGDRIQHNDPGGGLRDMPAGAVAVNQNELNSKLDFEREVGNLDEHSYRATPGPTNLPFTLKDPGRGSTDYDQTNAHRRLGQVYNATAITHSMTNQLVRKQDSPVMAMKIGTVLKLPGATRTELTILLTPHQPWLPTSFVEAAYWHMYPADE